MTDPRQLLLGFGLVAALCIPPAPASAQDFDYVWELDPATEIALVGLAGVVLTTPVFLVFDLVYAADREWLPPLVAGLQLGFVGLPWLAVGTALFIATDLDRPDLAVVASMLGMAFTAHASASLFLYEPPRPDDARAAPRKTARLRLTPWLSPDLKGGGVALAL